MVPTSTSSLQVNRAVLSFSMKFVLDPVWFLSLAQKPFPLISLADPYTSTLLFSCRCKILYRGGATSSKCRFQLGLPGCRDAAQRCERPPPAATRPEASSLSAVGYQLPACRSFSGGGSAAPRPALIGRRDRTAVGSCRLRLFRRVFCVSCGLSAVGCQLFVPLSRGGAWRRFCRGRIRRGTREPSSQK